MGIGSQALIAWYEPFGDELFQPPGVVVIKIKTS
jgi:hypothetical protein